jgi:glucose/arabinose dehydrogenase
VYNRGQGGLLDIVLHPDYSKMVGLLATLLQRAKVLVETQKIIRAKLENEALTNIESIYKCGPNTTKGQHFGSIVF